MKGLSKKQREVLDFIRAFTEEQRYSPSYRDIQEHFGYSSLGSVYNALKILKRKGAISAEKHRGRSLVVEFSEDKVELPSGVALPYIGTFALGSPIEMFQQTQTIEVPDYLVTNPENCYLLRARGDRFQEEMILEGDLIIVEARSEALPGEQILALINHQETYIKRYYPEENWVNLTSHSSEVAPLRIPQDHLFIQGVLVGLIRLFR